MGVCDRDHLSPKNICVYPPPPLTQIFASMGGGRHKICVYGGGYIFRIFFGDLVRHEPQTLPIQLTWRCDLLWHQIYKIAKEIPKIRPSAEFLGGFLLPGLKPCAGPPGAAAARMPDRHPGFSSLFSGLNLMFSVRRTRICMRR